MPTIEVQGLQPTLNSIVNTFERLLGDSGTGSTTLTPDAAPNPAIVVALPSGASLKLPPTISLSYKKTGNTIGVFFANKPTAIYKGFSVDITSVQIDLTQIHVNFAGMVGMIASITLKAAS